MTTETLKSQLVHPARPGSRPLTAEDLWRLPRVGSAAPAPDGSGCAVPVTLWDLEKNQSRTRIWWVPLEGGEPRPLTSDEFSSAEPAISPDGRRLAFTRKKEGGRPQIHLLPLDGGEARALTELPLGVFDPRWLPDGSGLVFGAQLIKGHLTPDATRAELERRDKDPVKAHVTEERFYRYWDTWLTTGEVTHLFHFDLASGTLRDLTPEGDWWFEWMDPSGQFDVAPDGREVAFSVFEFDATESLIRTRLWAVPLSGGAPRGLTRADGMDDARPRYSPDGRSIVFGRQTDPEFYADRVRLMRYDRASGKSEPIAADWKLSPMRWELTADGALLLETEEEARISLFRWSGSGEPARILRGGSVSGVRSTPGRLWLTRHTLTEPPEVHVCDLDGAGLRRVTRFTDEIASQFSTGEVRELSFEGAYGEPVQMYLILPPGHREGSKPPLLHVIHGGPHAVSADGFSFRWNTQAFAAQGYAVAMVNFQGSTSWGQDYAQRIQGHWADRPFQDVMRATDVLIESGLVDEQRMAAAGGSYGGYMISWIAGHTDRFRCLVNHAGVADLLAQYASDVTQGRGRAAGGEAWEGLENMERWSPARFASGFKTPMLVSHGERDYRVPVGNGLEIYGILKAKGVPARLVYFPDENHWVLKARNSLLWYREVLAWLERWLKD
jgi:dipeptidyl aminopeptidase/acylaminoacyl peptidase